MHESLNLNYRYHEYVFIMQFIAGLFLDNNDSHCLKIIELINQQSPKSFR